jgi:hypothetical protein
MAHAGDTLRWKVPSLRLAQGWAMSVQAHPVTIGAGPLFAWDLVGCFWRREGFSLSHFRRQRHPLLLVENPVLVSGS